MKVAGKLSKTDQRGATTSGTGRSRSRRGRGVSRHFVNKASPREARGRQKSYKRHYGNSAIATRRIKSLSWFSITLAFTPMKIVDSLLNRSEEVVFRELQSISQDNNLKVFAKPRLSDVILKGRELLTQRLLDVIKSLAQR
jgi:hypothetical protein